MESLQEKLLHFVNKIANMIFEPANRLEVITPKGDGIVWYLIDYGHETDTVYTVIINNTGELWQFTHKEIKVKPNFTFGRK